METIRKRLREIRESAGISREAMAKVLGTSFPVSAIVEIEEGERSIGLATLEKWCQACNAQWTLEITSRGKTHDLLFIRISPNVRDAWQSAAKEIRNAIKKKYPKLRPHEIPDEMFLEKPDGSGEIFVQIHGDRFSIIVPKGEWGFLAVN